MACFPVCDGSGVLYYCMRVINFRGRRFGGGWAWFSLFSEIYSILYIFESAINFSYLNNPVHASVKLLKAA